MKGKQEDEELGGEEGGRREVDTDQMTLRAASLSTARHFGIWSHYEKRGTTYKLY